eukprot:Platyproteum_vivax@DN6127_c0_g1_i1.p1
MFGLGGLGNRILAAGRGSASFDCQYQCFPISFSGKDELENGNKIVLPSSALDQLARLNISYPMLFEIRNDSQNRKSHCGVLEFTAEEGTCYVPYWLMQHLLLAEQAMVNIKNVSLPKGRYCKLQPVTSDFLEISNHKAVLEMSLRFFATLTKGDCIVISFNDKPYEIEVVDVAPGAAISVIETDVQVDFEAPKDYVPPKPKSPEPVAVAVAEADSVSESPGGGVFGGSGQRLDGKMKKTHAASVAGPPGQFHGHGFQSHFEKDDSQENEPWLNRLPGGVRSRNEDYDKLRKQGKIPGVASMTAGPQKSTDPFKDGSLTGGYVLGKFD